MEQQTEQKNGPMIGVIMIIIVIALGAYYLWEKEKDNIISPTQAVSVDRS